MFGKMTLVLAKSSLIGALGLAVAACALACIYRALVAIILGSNNHTSKFVKSRGLLLLAISAPLLLLGIIMMIKSESALAILSPYVDLLASIIPLS